MKRKLDESAYGNLSRLSSINNYAPSVVTLHVCSVQARGFVINIDLNIVMRKMRVTKSKLWITNFLNQHQSVPESMAPGGPEPPLSSSSKSFLKALSAATLSKGPIPTQLSDFYEAENELRRKYAAKEKVSDSYANLIPVFHSLVVASGADKTKSRQSTSFQGQYICPLKEGQRRPDGTDSFVQDGLLGFKRNWDIFTEGALQGVNWYNLWERGSLMIGIMYLQLVVRWWHVHLLSQKMW